MSDDSYGDQEVAAPAEAGVPDFGGDAPEAPPEPSYLDADEYAGHHVRLRVDGEEVSVPLAEALQGYSRTADYTRKTQALAEQQRQAQLGITLQQALANNPAATLRLLQEQYGVNFQEAPAQTEDEWEFEDPQEARFKEYDARLAAAEQYRADQELAAAVRVLQGQFGDDFNAREVVSRAVATGRMDLANIHKEMMFDRWHAQQQAQRETDARRSVEDATRTQAKAGVTAHSGGSPAGTVPLEQTSQPMSVSDAYFQAKKAHGLA